MSKERGPKSKKSKRIEAFITFVLIMLFATFLVYESTKTFRNVPGTREKSNGKTLYSLVMADSLGNKLVNFPSTQKSTTEFFKDLAGVGPLNSEVKVLKTDPSFVLGAGMSDGAEDWSSLTAADHGWQVAVGQSPTTAAETPFMIGKNWIPQTIPPGSDEKLSEKHVNHTGDISIDDAKKAWIIVVYHGGQAKRLTVGKHRLSDVNPTDQPVHLLPE